MSALILLALLPHASAADWPAGANIDRAATADITPEGFDAIAQIIPSMLPSSIEIPGMSDSYGYPDYCLGIEYAIDGMWAGIQVVNADITPGNGVLNISADILVNINNASDPFSLDFGGVLCISDSCGVYVEPFPVHIDTTLGLAVVDDGAGGRRLDATVGPVNVTYDLSSDYIVGDCLTLDIINTLGLTDLLIGQLAGPLNDQIGSLGPTIESAIEDAFAAATITQDLDLNGVTAHIQLYPDAVDITPAGVRVTMAGGVSADASTCVSAFDPGGSLKTDTPPPDIGIAPDGVRSPFHVGVSLSDDFANQTMYALWRGGLLCYTLAADNDTFPLDTSILNLLTGQAFIDIFPEAGPLSLHTLPTAAPTVVYDGNHDIVVSINDLDLEFYTELDGREIRVLSVGLNGPVGADLVLDGATGLLAVNLDINTENLTPSVVFNDLHPEANDAILSSFSSTLSSLVGSVIGGLLGDISFALPAFGGLGLQELDIAPTGSNADWLGAYAMLGPVTYGSADGGCGGCGGDTGSSGCSSGSSGCSSGGTSCSTTGGIPLGLFAAVPMGLAVMLRRRR